jgi:hypothetical protein
MAVLRAAIHLFDFVLTQSTAAIIPNHKMATPFCDFKTLTGFGF